MAGEFLSCGCQHPDSERDGPGARKGTGGSVDLVKLKTVFSASASGGVMGCARPGGQGRIRV